MLWVRHSWREKLISRIESDYLSGSSVPRLLISISLASLNKRLRFLAVSASFTSAVRRLINVVTGLNEAGNRSHKNRAGLLLGLDLVHHPLTVPFVCGMAATVQAGNLQPDTEDARIKNQPLSSSWMTQSSTIADIPQSSAQPVPNSTATAVLIERAALNQYPEVLLERIAARPSQLDGFADGHAPVLAGKLDDL